MDLLFQCSIPLKVAIKKNGKQMAKLGKKGKKKRRPISSRRYQEWERNVVTYLKYHWTGRDPIKEPIIMRATFELKNRQGYPDLSNAYQGLEDALQKAGVIENDRLIIGHDGSRIKVTGREATSVELYTADK